MGDFYPSDIEEDTNRHKGDPFAYGKKKNAHMSLEELKEYNRQRSKNSRIYGFNPFAPPVSNRNLAPKKNKDGTNKNKSSKNIYGKDSLFREFIVGKDGKTK
jgi:hypothetical protein